jgi:hypothetical protein
LTKRTGRFMREEHERVDNIGTMHGAENVTVNALAKPVARGPRPRTWIRRSALPRKSCQLPRRTRIERKARVRQQARGPLAAAKRLCRSLCSKITLHLGGYLCACGCGRRATDAMHVLAVGAFENLRFVLLNILPGARPCHERLGSATQKDETEMRRLLIHWRGAEAWTELERLSRLPGPDVYETLGALRARARELGIGGKH